MNSLRISEQSGQCQSVFDTQTFTIDVLPDLYGDGLTNTQDPDAEGDSVPEDGIDPFPGDTDNDGIVNGGDVDDVDRLTELDETLLGTDPSRS